MPSLPITAASTEDSSPIGTSTDTTPVAGRQCSCRRRWWRHAAVPQVGLATRRHPSSGLETAIQWESSHSTIRDACSAPSAIQADC